MQTDVPRACEHGSTKDYAVVQPATPVAQLAQTLCCAFSCTELPADSTWQAELRLSGCSFVSLATPANDPKALIFSSNLLTEDSIKVHLLPLEPTACHIALRNRYVLPVSSSHFKQRPWLRDLLDLQLVRQATCTAVIFIPIPAISGSTEPTYNDGATAAGVLAVGLGPTRDVNVTGFLTELVIALSHCFPTHAHKVISSIEYICSLSQQTPHGLAIVDPGADQQQLEDEAEADELQRGSSCLQPTDKRPDDPDNSGSAPATNATHMQQDDMLPDDVPARSAKHSSAHGTAAAQPQSTLRRRPNAEPAHGDPAAVSHSRHVGDDSAQLPSSKLQDGSASMHADKAPAEKISHAERTAFVQRQMSHPILLWFRDAQTERAYSAWQSLQFHKVQISSNPVAVMRTRPRQT
jgi:hypothetical protein